MKGIVKWYDAKKGFGFITREDGTEVFMHKSGISEGRVTKYLLEGDEVEFDQEVIEPDHTKTKAIGICLTKPVQKKLKK